MNQDAGIDKLVGLFEQTHSELQRQAGRAVNTAVVVRISRMAMRRKRRALPKA